MSRNTWQKLVTLACGVIHHTFKVDDKLKELYNTLSFQYAVTRILNQNKNWKLR